MRGVLLGAVFAGLAGCGGADVDAGATVYTASCATCHGADGTGVIEGAADLTVRVPAMTDAQIEDNINNGSTKDGFTMAPVTLSADDLANLVAYLRDTFGGGT